VPIWDTASEQYEWSKQAVEEKGQSSRLGTGGEFSVQPKQRMPDTNLEIGVPAEKYNLFSVAERILSSVIYKVREMFRHKFDNLRL
jgi:hypothetical protein